MVKMMQRLDIKQRGFTLIEIAIVLLIVSILLGYTVALFPVQQELKQYRNAESEMDAIIEHLIAFAQVNGRLPCPDIPLGGPPAVGDGLENRAGLNACTGYFGFVPARTLGIDGDYDQNNVLVDPWGTGYGYAVSNVNDGAGNFYLVNPNGIRTAGMAAVQPDLYLCEDNAALTNDPDCTTNSLGEVLGSNGEVAAVVISIGRDNDTVTPSSTIQAENLDGFGNGTVDKVYIYASRRDDYDDIVKWLPTNLLFSRMIDAEQLP